MNRLATIFLALVVCAANAYCACSAGGRAVSASRGEHRDVKDHEPQTHGCCEPEHHEQDQEPCHDGDQHTCAHCTGTLTADAPSAKTTVTPPAPIAHFLLPVFHLADAPVDPFGIYRDHTGLPPPVDRPTLFNLSCLLTI